MDGQPFEEMVELTTMSEFLPINTGTLTLAWQLEWTLTERILH